MSNPHAYHFILPPVPCARLSCLPLNLSSLILHPLEEGWEWFSLTPKWRRASMQANGVACSARYSKALSLS